MLRAKDLAFGVINCVSRHTVTGLLTSCGKLFEDWSANYRLFQEDRMQVRGLFDVIRKETVNRTLTIDFGDTGCEGNDGVVRSGKIIATFEGEYREPGSSVSVTLENYTADEHTFTGTKSVTNMREEDGHFKYTITVENASIEGSDGVFSWESSHTVERIEGNDTRRPYDDVYQVTGQSSGVNRRGIAFEKTIESPLIKDRKVRCLSNFVSGIVTLTNDDGGVVSIDYGDGTCDRQATLTINDNVIRTIFVR